jgi:hypothetical protein
MIAHTGRLMRAAGIAVVDHQIGGMQAHIEQRYAARALLGPQATVSRGHGFIHRFLDRQVCKMGRGN